MRRFIIVASSLLLLAGPAIAADPASPTIARRFLKVTPSTWDWFGIAFEKDGQRLGPPFFGVLPTDAVQGSPEGERHASRARVYQGFTFGLGIVGFGLLATSAGVRGADHHWNDTALILGGAGIGALLTSFICALGRDREVLEAVSAYNYDLVSGVVGTGTR